MFFLLLFFAFFFKNPLLSAGRMRFLKIKIKKKTKKMDQFLTYKKGNLGPAFNFTAYIYIYAVKLKTGPIFDLFKVKNWSIFLFFLLFFIFENLILPAERRGCLKNKQKQQQKQTQFLKLKLVQLCCATYLDQFLTLTWTSF